MVAKTGLVLPGGGARAAYQVGVLKGLSEELQERQPFPVICGTSAGAINAAALSIQAEQHWSASIQWLEQLWLSLHAERVYRTDWPAVLKNALRLVAEPFWGKPSERKPLGLLNAAPLHALLDGVLNFDRLADNIQQGWVEAVCVTAMNYSEGLSESFYQGGPEHSNWSRWRRSGVATPIRLHHLLASTAIPTVFPPVKIGGCYYGDGALRQLNPLSPALHLGAERILVITVSGHRRRYPHNPRRILPPSYGQVIGHLLNSAFIDSLESDIELLERLNELVGLMPDDSPLSGMTHLRPVEIEVISPSQDIDALAEEYAQYLPRSLRVFLGAVGASREQGGVNIASYLLFEPPFIEALIDLGYRDAKTNASRICEFMQGGCRGEHSELYRPPAGPL